MKEELKKKYSKSERSLKHARFLDQGFPWGVELNVNDIVDSGDEQDKEKGDVDVVDES